MVEVLMAESWTARLGVEDEKMRVEGKRTERRSGESGGRRPGAGSLAVAEPRVNRELMAKGQ